MRSNPHEKWSCRAAESSLNPMGLFSLGRGLDFRFLMKESNTGISPSITCERAINRSPPVLFPAHTHRRKVEFSRFFVFYRMSFLQENHCSLLKNNLRLIDSKLWNTSQ
ncbi:hypothetical protein CEXT_562281 [Caerostris extrusa]|uniref:Uncharacterized protein n=1 Tax=Caerostris extrusa TaxID=172846 RepID=A0AAV4SIL1_CAEEX|nr:hypothetical protein CEXT_562281 [Caerostris extrusa]